MFVKHCSLLSSVKLPWLGPPQARTTVVFFSQPLRQTSVRSSHVLIGVTLTLKSRIRATESCGIPLSGCRAPCEGPLKGLTSPHFPPARHKNSCFLHSVPTHPALWLPDSSQLFKIQRDAIKPLGLTLGLHMPFYFSYFALLLLPP